MKWPSSFPGSILHGVALIVLLGGFARGDAPSSVGAILRAQGFYEAPVIRDLRRNRDMVEVEINGHRFKMVVDTGAQTTILRRSAAERAHVPEGADTGLFSGVNGASTEHANVAQVSSFTINGVPVAPGPVRIADMGDYHRGHERYDGLLGLPTLRLNHVVFGYDSDSLYFQPQRPETGGLDSFLLTHGFARVRLAVESGHYFIPITFNATASRMVLDSGAPVTELTLTFGVKAGLSAAPVFGEIGGVEGRRGLTVMVLPDRIAIGPLPLPKVSVKAQTFALPAGSTNFGDGLAGWDLIGLLSPIVDAGHDWLYIAGQLPPGFKP